MFNFEQKPLYVANIARRDLETGNYNQQLFKSENTMLISINDPAAFPPSAVTKFKDKIFVYFLDVEDVENEFAIGPNGAYRIAAAIKTAMKQNLNVLVHCTAGICRSGAVAEACEVLGFEYIGNYKQPNVLVKKRLFRELGLDNGYE